MAASDDDDFGRGCLVWFAGLILIIVIVAVANQGFDWWSWLR